MESLSFTSIYIVLNTMFANLQKKGFFFLVFFLKGLHIFCIRQTKALFKMIK